MKNTRIFAVVILAILLASVSILIFPPHTRSTGFFIGEFSLTVGNGTENESVAANPGTSGASGSGSGGGGNVAKAASTFTVSPTLLTASLVQGDGDTLSLDVTNLQNKISEIRITIQDMEPLVSVDEELLTLQPYEKKTLSVVVFVPSDEEPGGRIGRVVLLDQAGNSRGVPIVIEVRKPYSLFDIILSIPSLYRRIAPGDSVFVLVELENVGLRGTLVDVPLTLKVISLEDKGEYAATRQTVAVGSSYATSKEIDLPETIPQGKYLVYGEIIYEPNITVSSYDTFEIVEPSQKYDWATVALFLAVLAFGSVGIVMMISLFMIERKNRLETQSEMKQISSALHLLPGAFSIPRVITHKAKVPRHSRQMLTFFIWAIVLVAAASFLISHQPTALGFASLDSSSLAVNDVTVILITTGIRFCIALFMMLIFIKSRNVFSLYFSLFFIMFVMHGLLRVIALASGWPSIFFLQRLVFNSSAVIPLAAFSSLGVNWIRRHRLVPLALALAIGLAFVDTYYLMGVQGESIHPVAEMFTSRLFFGILLLLCAALFQQWGTYLSRSGRILLVIGFMLQGLTTFIGGKTILPDIPAAGFVLGVCASLLIGTGWIVCLQDKPLGMPSSNRRRNV